MKAFLAAAFVVTGLPTVAALGQEGVTVTAPKQVCRRMEVPASGSRISRRRVCMTAAQWRARSEASRDDAEDDVAALNDLSREIEGPSQTLERKIIGARGPH
jgi:hypothetical protein